MGIGRALVARGHQVTLATNPLFAPLVRASGLPFEAVGTADELRAAMEHPDLWRPIGGFLLLVDRLLLAARASGL